MTPIFFADARDFRSWLEQHAASATELLVGFHKVGSGQPCMSWSASVDEALCFGWIDGRRTGIDNATYSIRFTPRKASSIWSVVNIAKMDKLRAEGKMTPAGEAAFALRTEAKSGIYAHERSDMPELADAERERFQRDKAAWDYFQAAPPGYRKTLLHWITKAKREDTRSKRLEQLMQACAEGRRLT
ncbi:YdeI/OmpD-associated family protein [Pseudoduganella sp. SL102]|uniref:YdeI/OmpD-associated family protein n=1 Tax=Pseudoduganella sp. SL102 TaxID=2995154 RepID=UPI00248BBF49|nr:YdeI/OmpD-associated family protein [Pseudoduganella sp. SL102]WBS00554.1 YdeI/OmpD-associated family protein [Pseudoduganella sp. SL102]